MTQAGEWYPEVAKANYGKANNACDTTTCPLIKKVLTIESESSSLAGFMNGNSTLTINGSGFSTNKSLTLLAINANPCPIIHSTNTQLTCILPPSETAGDFDLVLTVTNTQAIPNVQESAQTTFTYTAGAVPKLLSVDNDTVSPYQIVTLNIQTSNMTTAIVDDISVQIGNDT